MYENRFTSQAAILSAGGTLEAMRAVCSGSYDSSFALVRPPGHHAHCGKANGFCFFNNVAVAAKCA